MSAVAIGACLVALAVIGLLPRIFFRRGRLNARWWATASPFALAAAALVASVAGAIESPAGPLLRTILAWPSVIFAVAGVALIRWTLRTHARPVSLWHQPDDRPDELVTRGAYAHVRHPFYASFLLVLGACALALPHWLTAIALVGGFALLNRTAAREERRLVEAFGHHYMAYMKRSGRFFPRGIGGVAIGRRSGLRPPMAVIAVVLAASGCATPPPGQVDPSSGKVYAAVPDETPRHPLVEAIGQGALTGAFIGMIVTAGLCAWDELANGSTQNVWPDDEDEEGCGISFTAFVGPPVLGAAGGAVVGLLAGLLIWATEGLPGDSALVAPARDSASVPER